MALAFGNSEDRDTGRRAAVEIERLAVGLGAEFDAADVADSGDLAAIRAGGLDDDVFELADIVEPAFDVERVLEILSRRRRRRADLAGGDLLALLLDRVDDILRGQPARLQQVRVEPNAHGVLAGAEDSHRANAGKASYFVLYADDGVIRQKQAVVAAVRRDQRDEFEN